MRPFLGETLVACRRVMKKKGRVVTLVVFAGNAMGGTPAGIVLRAAAMEVPHSTAAAPVQTPPAAPQPEHPAAVAPQITYVAGQLTIRGSDLTLGDVLTKVERLTGTKLDFPAAAGRQQMPFVELGPGPAREVLAALLVDSGFDYMIQASDTDPDNVQSVVLMTRDAKGSGSPSGPEVARFGRGPFARAGAPPVEPQQDPAPAADNPAAAQPSAAGASPEPSPSNEAPVPPPPPAPAPSIQPGQSLFNQPRQGGALPVPASLTPQNINQQLQQMYQQRVQINQQERQAGTPTTPPN